MFRFFWVFKFYIDREKKQKNKKQKELLFNNIRKINLENKIILIILKNYLYLFLTLGMLLQLICF